MPWGPPRREEANGGSGAAGDLTGGELRRVSATSPALVTDPWGQLTSQGPTVIGMGQIWGAAAGCA
jgi:hypothetical protein